jgi:tetratricopeptide (TPR) repeat protein
MRRTLWLAVTIFVLFISDAYALNLDKMKVHLMSGDYKSAISEGERLIAVSGRGYGADELYYLLGLSYLKDGNYLRASDIFEIIIKEFNKSSFKEAAMVGAGDSYFLKGDYRLTMENYRRLMSDYPHSKFKALAYSRLAQGAAKSGDIALASNYEEKLKQEFPLYKPSALSCEFPPSGKFYYCVQTGSFLSKVNANNLVSRLKQKGYPAYLEASSLDNKTIYRVKVGKFQSRQEALKLEDKLSGEGYPTKVCP